MRLHGQDGRPIPIINNERCADRMFLFCWDASFEIFGKDIRLWKALHFSRTFLPECDRKGLTQQATSGWGVRTISKKWTE